MTAARELSQVTDRGQGRCALSGELTFDSAPVLWRQLATSGLLKQAREADLAGIGESDSAGLALLVAWKAECQRAGQQLSFTSVPARIAALAALTDAQVLLETPR